MINNNNQIKNQQGASLIEVMVALFVLAIGLLGILAMQAQSMRFNQSAYSYSQAVFLAHDILESIRANPEAGDEFNTDFTTEPTTAGLDACEGKDKTCTDTVLAGVDVNAWKAAVQRRLPAGQAEIRRDGDTYTITVRFDDSRVTNNGDGEPHSYVLVAQI